MERRVCMIPWTTSTGAMGATTNIPVNPGSRGERPDLQLPYHQVNLNTAKRSRILSHCRQLSARIKINKDDNIHKSEALKR